jgi:glycosyltransferase involved in cell wall biosynthesis
LVLHLLRLSSLRVEREHQTPAAGGDANADVTVVIPCFNHGRYVGEAVQSALGQAGGPPAVVVVDDGSTDPGTGPALDALPPEVEVLRRSNQGPAAARNAGAARTDTPLLLFLDADDLLAGDAISTLKAGLASDPDCGYAYGVMRLFGAQTGEIRFPDFDAYRLLYRPMVGGPGAMLLRRTAFDEVGGFDEDVPGYEDWDLQLAALEHGRSGRLVPEVTLEYRKHDTSRLSGDRGKHRELFRALRANHPGLYARRGELARDSELGPLGRLAYRTYWAWRPLPAAVEQTLYRVMIR